MKKLKKRSKTTQVEQSYLKEEEGKKGQTKQKKTHKEKWSVRHCNKKKKNSPQTIKQKISVKKRPEKAKKKYREGRYGREQQAQVTGGRQVTRDEGLPVQEKNVKR